MKLLDVRWFTNRDGSTGIMRVEDKWEGIKYYIGGVTGMNEIVDMRYVADWGSTFDYAAGNTLFGVTE